MLTRCPSCQRQLQVADEWLGKKARCPGCQAAFVIELEAAIASAPTPAVPAAPKPKPAAEPKSSGNPFAFDDDNATRRAAKAIPRSYQIRPLSMSAIRQAVSSQAF